MILSRVFALQTFFFELRESFCDIKINLEVQSKEVTLDLGHRIFFFLLLDCWTSLLAVFVTSSFTLICFLLFFAALE